MLSSFETLKQQIRDLRVSVSSTQEAQLQRYVATLEHWDRSINLTALEGARLTERLVAEPLWVAQELQPSGRYLDVGSGNGSPALPWHVLRSFLAVDLVESRRRRAVFLKQITRQMGLSAVRVHPVRLERIAAGLRSADWITLQGVRLSPGLLNELAMASCETTRLVWFTKTATEPPIPAELRLQIPNSARCAFVFRIGNRTSSGSG